MGEANPGYRGDSFCKRVRD